MTLKSALITGGNGNLGHLLADHFENIGIHVISYDNVKPQRPVASRDIIIGDIRNSKKLSALFEKNALTRLSILPGCFQAAQKYIQ